MPWNSTHIYDSHQNFFHVAFLGKGLLVCCFLLCIRPTLLCTWWLKLVRESFEKFLSYFVLVIYCNRLKLLVLYEFNSFPMIFCRFTSENKCRSMKIIFTDTHSYNLLDMLFQIVLISNILRLYFSIVLIFLITIMEECRTPWDARVNKRNDNWSCFGIFM